MRFSSTIERSLVDALVSFTLQGGIEALLHGSLAGARYRRGAHVQRLADHRVGPSWPVLAGICLEQNPGVGMGMSSGRATCHERMKPSSLGNGQSHLKSFLGHGWLPHYDASQPWQPGYQPLRYCSRKP
jgi:hypothetical protein